MQFKVKNQLHISHTSVKQKWLCFRSFKQIKTIANMWRQYLFKMYKMVILSIEKLEMNPKTHMVSQYKITHRNTRFLTPSPAENSDQDQVSSSDKFFRIWRKILPC